MSDAERASPPLADEDRRRVLHGLAALVAASAAPTALAQSAAPALSAGAFVAMTRTLTGYASQDPVAANALLRALTSAVGTPTLTRIADLAARTPPAQLSAALASAGLDKPAGGIVAALYSGVVETARGPVVVTYVDALAWQAVPWTKPNAICGGITNYWSTAPAQPMKAPGAASPIARRDER